MDKQAEVMAAVKSAVTAYLSTTRGSHAFGAGGRLDEKTRSTFVVRSSVGDDRHVEVIVLDY